jgi:hypothetical protein
VALKTQAHRRDALSFGLVAELGWSKDAEVLYDRLADAAEMRDELEAIDRLCYRIIDDPAAAAVAAVQLRGEDDALRWKLETRTRTHEPCVIWHMKEGQPIMLWLGNSDFTVLA